MVNFENMGTTSLIFFIIVSLSLPQLYLILQQTVLNSNFPDKIFKTKARTISVMARFDILLYVFASQFGLRKNKKEPKIISMPIPKYFSKEYVQCVTYCCKANITLKGIVIF